MVPPVASAPPLEQRGWQFSRPVDQLPPPHTSLFNVSIKPREPPTFSGDKGQDVTAWLHQVDDYLEFVQPDDRQAVAYVILLLTGNARCWWEAECVSRGGHCPGTLQELKTLLKAQFESPVRENRARTELLKLRQKDGETAGTYMARMKMLLSKVPGYDLKTALQQWILGLREPFRLEAAKAGPRTLAEAESLVSRLEDAMEFVKTGKSDQPKNKQAKTGNDSGKQQFQKKKQQWNGPESQKWQNTGNYVLTSNKPPQQSQGQNFRGSGRGGSSQSGPYRAPHVTFHPVTKRHDGPGGRGRGRGRHQKPRVAYVMNVTEEEFEEMAGNDCPEFTQQVDESETVASQGQSLGN